MKHFFSIILLFFCFTATSQNIGEIFSSLKDDNFRWIDESTRHQLVETYKSTRQDSIRNSFGEQIRLEILDEENHYMKVRTSDVGTMELKTFPDNNGSYIVALCVSVCAPVCDSHIIFFDRNLKQINEELFASNSIADFINVEKLTENEKSKKAKSEAIKNFVKKISFIFNEIHLSEYDNKILLSHDFESLLDKDIYAEIKPFLSGNAMDFNWNGKFFNHGKSYWK